MAGNSMTTERIEDYLEAIDNIIGKKGYAQVRDVSRLLNVGPSSVTEMFQKLNRLGYINYEKYGGVTLTSKGTKLAKETKVKHVMLREFLLILGVDDKIAEEDACRLEHILNPETLDRLTKFNEFVKWQENMPRWLDHFKHFFETGEYVECTPSSQAKCPVHGSRSKAKSIHK